MSRVARRVGRLVQPSPELYLTTPLTGEVELLLGVVVRGGRVRRGGGGGRQRGGGGRGAVARRRVG